MRQGFTEKDALQTNIQYVETMELVMEFLEDSIEPQRFERLNWLLLHDPDARRIYLELIAIHQDLTRIFGKSAQASTQLD